MDVRKHPIIVERRAVRRTSCEGVCVERGRILRSLDIAYVKPVSAVSALVLSSVAPQLDTYRLA